MGDRPNSRSSRRPQGLAPTGTQDVGGVTFDVYSTLGGQTLIVDPDVTVQVV